MIYNLENKKEQNPFLADVDRVLLLKKTVELKDVVLTRSEQQNKARWLYLTMIAEILNERGETFNPKGMTIDVPFTKDNLYWIYWQSLRNNMFPNKKEQLNTKEFTNLVEMAQMLFAKIFSIDIEFPHNAFKGIEDEKNIK